ncbi:unnamed protein product [Ixodes hexagonus]
MQHWIQTYGKVFGYYVGDEPYLAITDMELVKQFFVKDATVSCERPPLLAEVEPFVSSLMFLPGKFLWKSVRSALNPTFSAAKLRTTTEIIQVCADEMLKILHGMTDQGIDVDMLSVCRAFSMDVITKSAFAWQVDCQKDPDHPLLETVRKLISSDDFIIENCIRFPILRKVLKWLYPYASYYTLAAAVAESVQKVIDLRRNGQCPRKKDLLQLLLDAQSGAQDAPIEQRHVPQTIEDRHILATSFIFLVAGFDTTASALAFVMNILAKYPEEQERVLDEIGVVFPGNSELTYDGLQQLKRLDMVILETLRMYPPVIYFTSRLCTEKITVADKCLPAGVSVMVPVWHVHHDPELWPEPFSFKPERFAEGNRKHDSATYLPFGLGPRQCIGKRFALLELKIAVCEIVRNFKICQSEHTQDPLEVSVPSVVMIPEKEVYVKLQPRL